MPDKSEQIDLQPLAKALIRDLGKGLHDMAQPLTTLQCRLYLGTLEEDPVALKAVVEDGVLECEQIMAWVHQLQTRLEQVNREMKG